MALKSPQPVPSLWLSENKASQDLFSPLVGMLAPAQPSSSALRIKTYLLTVLHEGEKCIYGCLVVAQNDKSSPNSVVPNGTILKRLIKKNRRFVTWGRPL